MNDVGLVAIGRNEGERLRRCLTSAGGLGGALVYVDSGSNDGSVDLARSLGADVVELDLTKPFTAARARNAGFDRLLANVPGVRYVQFIDGDCELAQGWLSRAREELEARPRAAVVCGRRRERRPGDSIYNRLADLEWDTPIGEAKACGGDAMMRVEALRDVGGYDPSLIAGEEPELCVRIRGAGWTVHRVDAEMTLHDMAMTRFSQWWRRTARAGHAFAEGAAMHGKPPERHFARETQRIIVWGLVFPLIALILAWPTRGLSLIGLAVVYALQMTRIYGRHRRDGVLPADARALAFFTVVGKIAEVQGALRYWLGRASGRRSRVIEYRGASAAGAVDGPGS